MFGFPLALLVGVHEVGSFVERRLRDESSEIAAYTGGTQMKEAVEAGAGLRKLEQARCAFHIGATKVFDRAGDGGDGDLVSESCLPSLSPSGSSLSGFTLARSNEFDASELSANVVP